MEAYQKTVKSMPMPELNEVLAFQANCLFEAKKLDQLFTFLTNNEKYFFRVFIDF